MLDRLLLPILCGASLLLVPAATAHETDRNPQILVVSATGTERITASVADVRLAVEERGLTDEEARNRMTRRSNRLLDFLRAEDVERLETTSLRLHPIYDYTTGDREVVGYQAVSVLRFRSEAAHAGQIIDEAIERGANQVQNLEFTAPEEEMESARHEALRDATRLALERADAVLEELGLERKGIVRIHVESVDEAPPPVPLHRMESRGAAADRAPTDVEAGEPAVNASVTLEISY